MKSRTITSVKPLKFMHNVIQYSTFIEKRSTHSGANDYIGQGTGGLIAGLVTRNLGWQFYFYLTGAAYLLGLLLNLVFVQDSPKNSW